MPWQWNDYQKNKSRGNQSCAPIIPFIFRNILIQARLKDFADNDPAVMEQMVQETKDALEATNR